MFHALTFTIGWLKLGRTMFSYTLSTFNFHHRVVETKSLRFQKQEKNHFNFHHRVVETLQCQRELRKC